MALTYTDEDLLSPGGNNDLSPQAMFFQRALYKNKIYPQNVPSPLDTWYNKSLFGRVDNFQNTITPREGKLLQVERAISSKIYALDFVAFSFRDLVLHLQEAAITARLFSGGNNAIVNIKATKGYTSPHVKYKAYQQSLIDSYIASLPEKRNEKIVDFVSFCEDFLPYLLFMAQTYPVTKSNFLLGNMVSPYISGLSLAIALDPAENDEIKYRRFLRDVNFDFYAKTAKKFGFLVNKNMPWVLTADLFSSVVLDNLSPWRTSTGGAVTPKNFFPHWYAYSYESDLLDLMNIFVDGYESLLNQKLYYQNKTFVCDKELKIRVLPREPRTPETTNTVLTANFVINLYVDLRQIESKNALSPVAVGQVKRKAILLYRAGNFWTALLDASEYINSVYREYIYSTSATKLITNSWIRLDKAPNMDYTTYGPDSVDPYGDTEDY